MQAGGELLAQFRLGVEQGSDGAYHGAGHDDVDDIRTDVFHSCLVFLGFLSCGRNKQMELLLLGVVDSTVSTLGTGCCTVHMSLDIRVANQLF
ncbi:hypothetical protein D3C85_1596400 [compost metagenome]